MSNEPSDREKFDWAMRHVVRYCHPDLTLKVIEDLEELYGIK